MPLGLYISKNKFTHAKSLLQELNSLNIYQLNIYQRILFMYKVKNGTMSSVFKKNILLNK